ncbi:MAG: 3-dehydroquinate synthase [Bacteroidetes bacterium]|nr:3-dehydroquinate synthase [Bacteroidota bacterium]
MKRILQQTFTVHYQYQVLFSKAIFDSNNQLLSQLLEGEHCPKVLFVVDNGVAQAHPELLQNIQAYAEKYKKVFSLAGTPMLVPGGEEVKNNFRFLQQVMDATNQLRIDRHSFVIAIGGGALLDMAGFAAAVAHRGVKFIRVPTTVLAQNDSGVGVKNSVNAFGKKNFLGTFAPPFAVINDSTFLSTLHERDWRSGIAEAIKVALIKDKSFFEQIEQEVPLLLARDLETMNEQICRCAELHLQHIGQGGDPFEKGSSRPLDFGHWAAHKLEQLTSFELRHGEAVAIGIALDCTYSYLQNMISEEVLMRIINLIRRLGFALYVPELNSNDLSVGLQEFREHLGGRLTIMLLQNIGQGVEVHEMDTAKIAEAARLLREFQQTQLPN